MKKVLLAIFLAALMGGTLCLSVSAAESIVNTDTRSNQMSNKITYAEGIQYVTVHQAKAEGHHFLLGGAILKYGDVWICSYGQGWRSENDNGSRFACKYSYDNGKTWGEEVEIAGVEGKYCRSHGVLFEYQGKVWAFCPRAAFGSVPDGTYPELIMEAYTLQEDMSWKYEGNVLDDAFWPLCEPMVLANGEVLIAGLDCRNGGAAPAIALSNGDMTKWEMINIPNQSKINLWGETAVIDYGDRLVAFIRTNSGKVAVSESLDYGKSWSSLILSDLDIANSKVYGGVLSTGSKYLIYNLGSRATMMIAVGDTDGSYGFNSMYLIRNGYVTEPNFLNNRQWAYPYAVEEDGYLYVVYSEHKENCELAIIPVSALQVKEEDSETVPQYEDRVYAQEIVLPEHRVLYELVDGTESWWSGDGESGKENVVYGTISGTPVVVRKQSLKSASKGNQVLRRHFDVDLKGKDTDRLAFVITFYSTKSLSASPSSTHRLFWGDSYSKTGKNLPFSGDYTINTRLDYRAASGNLWGRVKAGWNTWLISFNTLGYSLNAENINSFFIIFGDNSQLSDGDTIFALSSVRIIELLEEEEQPPVTETAGTAEQTEITTVSEVQETEDVDVSDDSVPPATSSQAPDNYGPVVTLGALGAVALAGGLAYLCYRKKHHKKGRKP